MTSTPPPPQTSLSYESPGLKNMFFLFRVSFGRLRIKDFRAWHLEPASSAWNRAMFLLVLRLRLS